MEFCSEGNVMECCSQGKRVSTNLVSFVICPDKWCLTEWQIFVKIYIVTICWKCKLYIRSLTNQSLDTIDVLFWNCIQHGNRMHWFYLRVSLNSKASLTGTKFENGTEVLEKWDQEKTNVFCNSVIPEKSTLGVGAHSTVDDMLLP